jgi:hypothetical protein
MAGRPAGRDLEPHGTGRANSGLLEAVHDGGQRHQSVLRQRQAAGQCLQHFHGRSLWSTLHIGQTIWNNELGGTKRSSSANPVARPTMRPAEGRATFGNLRDLAPEEPTKEELLLGQRHVLRSQDRPESGVRQGRSDVRGGSPRRCRASTSPSAAARSRDPVRQDRRRRRQRQQRVGHERLVPARQPDRGLLRRHSHRHVGRSA